MNPSCPTCVPHFKPDHPNSPAYGGRCLRYPPKVIFMGWGKHNVTQQNTPIIENMVPHVGKDDVCGEHPFFATQRLAGSPGAGFGKIPVLGPSEPLAPAGGGEDAGALVEADPEHSESQARRHALQRRAEEAADYVPPRPGDGAAYPPPDGGEVAELVDGTDAEVVPGQKP